MAVDVKNIINNIDAEIQKNGSTAAQLMSSNPELIQPDAKDYDYYFFSKKEKELLDEEGRMMEVHFYKDTPSTIGGFFQRIIRRMVRFLVLPMAEEQTAFNERSVKTKEMMLRIIREQQKGKEALDKTGRREQAPS